MNWDNAFRTLEDYPEPSPRAGDLSGGVDPFAAIQPRAVFTHRRTGERAVVSRTTPAVVFFAAGGKSDFCGKPHFLAQYQEG